MPRLILLAVLLAMLTAVSVAAQDDAYRLRKAPADEYFGAIPGIIAAWQEQMPVSYTKVSTNPVVEVIVYELQQGYTEADMFAQDFDTLSSAFDSMQSIVYAYDPISNGSSWGKAMLQAWLRENPVDLAEVEKLDIPGFSISVSPIDLDGDGTDEFWLQVGFGWLNAYLVLQRDSAQAGGYRFVETPLPWLDSQALHLTGSPTDYEVLYFEDLNGDTVPEWVVRAYRNWGCSALSLMTWQNGSLVSLLRDEPTTCLSDTYLLENLDDDSDLEFIMREFDEDNWKCERTITRLFDWNGVYFELLDERPERSNSLGCALSEAEPLMWESRAAEAIPLYEAGLEAGWIDPTDGDSSYYAGLEQYARARLALAYALVGRFNDGIHMLEALATEGSFWSDMVGAMLKARSPLEMCTAAYNVFREYELSTFDNPFPVQIGREDYITTSITDYPPDARKAGCDAPRLIDELLQDLDFPADQSPIDVLAEAGIGVLNTFVADFNGDGADEWLVWLEARVTPLLFAPQGDEYVLSRPEVRYPSEFTSFGIQAIPGQDELLFVDYVVLNSVASNVDYLTYDFAMAYCKEDLMRSDHANPGEVRIWRLENHTFAQVLIAPVCQPRAFADLFNEDGSQLFAAARNLIGDRSSLQSYVESVYTWDPSQQTYVPPPDLAVTVTPRPTSASSQSPGVTDAKILDILYDSRYQIENADDPAAALAQIDGALANHDPMVDDIAILGLRYYRAVALKALNRPDEALAEYVALVETVPDSCWAMLARLHIEAVGG